MSQLLNLIIECLPLTLFLISISFALPRVNGVAGMACEFGKCAGGVINIEVVRGEDATEDDEEDELGMR